VSKITVPVDFLVTLNEKRGSFENWTSYSGFAFPPVAGKISIGTSNLFDPSPGLI